MRNLAFVLFAFVLASQAQAQMGVRTILDYGGGGRSENNEGKTTMNLTTENAPPAARKFIAEWDKEEEAATIMGEEAAEVPCAKQSFSHWLPTHGRPSKASAGTDTGDTDTGDTNTNETKSSSDMKLGQCFWTQSDQEYGKYTRFFGTDGNVAASTEIISDTLYGVRIYVTTAVSSQSDDAGDSEELADDAADDAASKNLNLLTASGGNLSVGATYPIYARTFPDAGGRALWNAIGRAGSTLQQLGISTEEGGSESLNLKDMNANFEAATEFQLDFLTAQQKIGLTAYAKIGTIAGTKKFAEALGADSQNFWYHQLGVGLKLADTFDIYLTWNHFSDDKLPNDGAVVTVTLGR
ncbi:MAG: hypothetical protein ABUT39_23580 [Acidobacteriota bacterium]